jgi:arginine:ornithine antiporter / lysine permease
MIIQLEPVKKSPSKLTLSMLIALTIGSMIGSGIFNLPQNMAAHAGGEAILIGWLITGAGMLTLCFIYQTLAINKPDLNNGIYAYARASSGEFVGFNSAWGYWVSAVLGNVSYLIAAFAALGYFFPIFGEGNNTLACLGASLTLWLTHYFILRGIKGAALLNVIITFAKILPLLLFIILAILAFQFKIFQSNFWRPVTVNYSLLKQIENTMLVTVWVFIGIEGASVYSARAKHRADIGKATLTGFIITLFLLMAVSLLSLGILHQAELAQLKNLSMAGVLEKIIGHWGAIVIAIGLLLSVTGAFLAWTLLAVEALLTPAKDGLMPACLASENNRGVPVNALWLTSGVIQLFLIIILFSKATYLALVSIATAMILIPYLFSAIYATKIAWSGETNPGSICHQRRDIILGIISTIYCCWLLYAAGHYLLLSSLLYIPGIILYMLVKHQKGKRTLRRFERLIAGLILTLAIIAIYLLLSGKMNLLT